MIIITIIVIYYLKTIFQKKNTKELFQTKDNNIKLYERYFVSEKEEYSIGELENIFKCNDPKNCYLLKKDNNVYLMPVIFAKEEDIINTDTNNPDLYNEAFTDYLKELEDNFWVCDFRMGNV